MSSIRACHLPNIVEFWPSGKIRHYSKGSKIGNTLLTRIRLDRSELNLHRFVIGQSDSPQCLCYARQESSLHFMIDCFLYSVERQVLFGQVEQYVPNFSNLSKIKQYEILVFGLKRENPEYYYTNRIISIAVQNFIFKTKRFSNIWTKSLPSTYSLSNFTGTVLLSPFFVLYFSSSNLYPSYL